MQETIGNATLRDAAIGTGIAVDKMLALTGQSPAVAVQINFPTPEERARMDRDDQILDALTKRIADQQQN
jgi:hypothetical protein